MTEAIKKKGGKREGKKKGMLVLIFGFDFWFCVGGIVHFM